jgi:hypothetical protein
MAAESAWSWTAARRGSLDRGRHPAGPGPPPARPVKIVSPRKESDTVQILSGTFEGKTLGTPICHVGQERRRPPEAYSEMATKFRPSHADYTYQAKFGIRAWPGGGRTSARETVGRVAAGAIAKKILRSATASKSSLTSSQVQRIVARWTRRRSRPRTSSPTSSAAPTGGGAAHDSAHREDAPAGRQRRRHCRGRRARRPARLGRTGVRPPRSGPGQGHAEPARRPRASTSAPASAASCSPARSITTRSARKAARSIPPPTAPAASRAASRTARPSTSASPSSPSPPSCTSRTRWTSSSRTPR